jgi:hypothetical protein
MIAFRAYDRPTLVFYVRHIDGARAAARVAEAVMAVDLGAKVHIDVVSRRVDVEPGAAGADDFEAALAAAGYAAALVLNSADFAFVWVDTRTAPHVGRRTERIESRN